MARRLFDIRPGRNALREGVSLVHRGANGKEFLISKADGDVDAVVTQLLADPAPREGVLLDAIRKAGGNEDVEKAAAAAARAMDAVREAFGDDGIPDEVLKAMNAQMDADDLDEEDEPSDDDLAKAADVEEPVYKRDFTAEQRRTLAKKGYALPNGSYPIETKADIGPALTLARSGHGDTAAAMALIKRRAKELGAEDQLPTSNSNVQKEDRMSETAVVPVKKEDGTYDLSAVPEDARAAVEAVLKARDDSEAELVELRKQADEQKSKADEAVEIAKAERDRRELGEQVDIAKAMTSLAKDDSELGALLHEVAKAERDEHLPEGTREKLVGILKAADEQIAKGDLFTEAGAVGRGVGGSDAGSKIDAKADEIRKAEPDLTQEQAIAKALELHPELYDDYRRENG